MLSEKLKKVRSSKKNSEPTTPVIVGCFKKMTLEDIPKLDEHLKIIDDELRKRTGKGKAVADIKLMDIKKELSTEYDPVTFYLLDKSDDFIKDMKSVPTEDMKVVRNYISKSIEDIKNKSLVFFDD